MGDQLDHIADDSSDDLEIASLLLGCFCESLRALPCEMQSRSRVPELPAKEANMQVAQTIVHATDLPANRNIRFRTAGLTKLLTSCFTRVFCGISPTGTGDRSTQLAWRHSGETSPTSICTC